jgi:hypothetical protein
MRAGTDCGATLIAQFNAGGYRDGSPSAAAEDRAERTECLTDALHRRQSSGASRRFSIAAIPTPASSDEGYCVSEAGRAGAVAFAAG